MEPSAMMNREKRAGSHRSSHRRIILTVLAVAAATTALVALTVIPALTGAPATTLPWSSFSVVGGSSTSDIYGMDVAISPMGGGQSESDLYQVEPGFISGSVPPPTPGGKLPWPGDSDGDGCADANENLPKGQSTQGGGRDYLDPYDWYDINQDGVIDLLNDILGVIQHYQPTPGGAPPYDVVYDRGPTTGPNGWNRAPPDGVIDLLNDILGVIQQYSPTGCTDPGP